MLLPFSHSRRASAVLAFFFLFLFLWHFDYIRDFRSEPQLPQSPPPNTKPAAAQAGLQSADLPADGVTGHPEDTPGAPRPPPQSPEDKPLTGGAASLIPSSGNLHPDGVPPTHDSVKIPIELTGTDNATLGFQTILAVSPEKSWRSEGLKAAAGRTNLSVVIPPQRKPTDLEINDFVSRSRSGNLNTGSAKAWLAHLQVIATAGNFTTALIMEDDSDWDIRIHEQARNISAALRKLTRTANPEPWGDNWDILWLGHCGEKMPFEEEKEPEQDDANSHFRERKRKEQNPFADDYITYYDETLPKVIGSYDPRMSDPKHLRWVQHATGPICTFAYAVNRASVGKMLAMQHGNEQAFDLWMHTRCRSHDLRCYSSNPEIFHHQQAAGQASSLVNEGKVIDEHRGNRTENIMFSARCNAERGDDDLVSCINWS
ncbi:glycosyltransferase family 25 protein [Aplosporella prunicola CBS 121167]|uniref:Glycosyltransferase family 25 protein n=1 Tax=Aplosporella prunicola CBS 121167 TaxID=1176127 RepID=A0A6A6BQY6_9PEZI|nr:glycosyltransferase family 25 protein [Aplosporella prunicola CBS 121167]KAF2146420.1 glycosyltransferase family 25 protein [Aplosporella prunicola CBS 121167]